MTSPTKEHEILEEFENIHRRLTKVREVLDDVREKEKGGKKKTVQVNQADYPPSFLFILRFILPRVEKMRRFVVVAYHAGQFEVISNHVTPNKADAKIKELAGLSIMACCLETHGYDIRPLKLRSTTLDDWEATEAERQ